MSQLTFLGDCATEWRVYLFIIFPQSHNDAPERKEHEGTGSGLQSFFFRKEFFGKWLNSFPAPQLRFYHLFESYLKRLELTFSQFHGKNITVTYKNNDNVIKQLLVHASAVRMSRYWLLGKSCASSNSSLFRALQTSHWSAQYLDIRAAEAWTNRFITLSEAINAEVNLNFCYCTSTRLCLPHSYVFALKLRDSLLKSLKIIPKKMAKSKLRCRKTVQ